MGKPIEAFIFDLDGVIANTAEYHYLAWKQLCDELGIPFDRTVNEQLKGIGRLESLEKILSAAKEENRFTQAEKESLAERKNRYYLQLIQRISPNDILPGIPRFLDEIKAGGMKIGLASASKNAFAIIEKLGIRHYFDYIVDASAVKNGKPDPEIFLKAADGLGVQCEHCVGVEDAEAGVQAIKSANMFAVGVGDRKILAKADLVVEDTTRLNLGEILNMIQ